MKQPANFIRVTLLVVLLLIANTAVYAESIDMPLYEKKVDLVFHKSGLFKRKIRKLTLKCADDSIPYLKLCNSYIIDFTYKHKRSGKVIDAQNYGPFPKSQLRRYFVGLLDSYDSRYNYGPLILGTGAGIVFGLAIAKQPGAVLGGVIGLAIDLIKLPIALAYTAFSKVKRALIKRRLTRRFNKFLFNKKFKATKIKDLSNFRNMLNRSIEFSSRTIHRP